MIVFITSVDVLNGLTLRSYNISASIWQQSTMIVPSTNPFRSDGMLVAISEATAWDSREWFESKAQLSELLCNLKYKWTGSDSGPAHKHSGQKFYLLC